MSEDSRKGISLRTKRKGRPEISAPKQISGPIQQTGDVPRSTGGKSSFEAPPQRPLAGGKVCIMATFRRLVADVIYRLLILSNVDIPQDSMPCLPISMAMLLPFPLYPPYRINMHPQTIVLEGLRQRKALH